MDSSLVVAVAALALSIMTAGWNVLAWVRAGGQVRVDLKRGVLDSSGALATGPFRTYAKWANALNERELELHQEIAVIRAENRGRTAVTIFEPAIDIGLYWSQGRFRPFRRTVSPRLVPWSDASAATKVRLEPFDVATFLFDVGVVLEGLDEIEMSRRPRRRYVLRGSIRVAGKSRRRRSPLRAAFVVPAGRWTLGPSPTAKQVVYRALERAKLDDEVSFNYAKASLIADLVESGGKVTNDRIRERLDEVSLPPSEHHSPLTDAITARRALVKHRIIDGETGQKVLK